jgi:hypothetical protein
MTETFLDATPFGPGALRGECPINTGYECPINTGYETAFGMFLFRTSVL